MNENNGFILKAEMYNQDEWYQMYLSMLKVCKKLQQENTELKIQISSREEVAIELQDRIEKATKIIKNIVNIWETKPSEIATLDLKELIEILKD